MKRTVLVLSLAVSQVLGTALAADSRKEEHIGVGAGAAIGGVAGGPVGLIIGAAVGGFMANRVQTANAVPGLEAEVELSRAEVDTLRQQLIDTESDLAVLRQEAPKLALERAISEGVQLEVLFATGESELQPEPARRLADLASLINTVPDLQVRLDGYADPRGEEVFNDNLSAERAAAVQALLVGNGIEVGRITSQPHGERNSSAPDGNLDAYAMERRVSIRLTLDSSRAAVAKTD